MGLNTNTEISIDKKEIIPEKKVLKYFHIKLYKNMAMISIELFNERKIKFGYKEKIGRNSVKENLIAGFLLKSGLLD